MKLLVQSDDYGFTRGITLGILDAVERGIVTCTGLFVNMPESAYAASRIQDYPETCFGIDFNIVSGPCVADPKQIPHLVDSDGIFIRSTVKYADPNFGQAELWPYEEVLVEIRAQLQRYRDLTGRNPEYLHGHSISRVSPAYIKAIEALSVESGIPYSQKILNQFNVGRMKGSWNIKPFSLENQMKTSALEYVKAHADELLDYEYAMIGGHAGFVDADIFRWSTYSLIRCKDHEMMTSDFMKEWIDKHHIQLISYRDLKDTSDKDYRI